MEVFKIFATMSLRDAVSRPLTAIRSAMNDTDGAAGRLSGRLGRLAVGLGTAAIGGAVFLGVLSSMVGDAIAFESKMADVAKVVDFETPAELREMSNVIQDLSLQIPIAAEGFADIVAAAAQSGIAKDDLVDFSVQAAKMGVAFDIAAGEASKTMADWRAGMGLTLDETYALADSVNHLANNMNATASDISQVLNRAGAVGKSVGLSSQQVSALAATVLSAGADASVAGTGLNNLFTTLADGSSMSKSAAAAFKSMGFDINTLGAQMQADAQGTIMRVMEGIASLSQDKQIAAIKNIFGDLGVKNIAPMVGNLDNLRQAFGLVGDAANYAGSMETEYAARSATTENSIQLLQNSLNVFRITIGSLFLPAVNSMVKGLSWLVQVFIKAARSEFGAFLIKLAAATSVALVGVTGLITAFIFLKPAILMVAGVLSSVFWPVTLIAGAVALLALAWKKNFMGIATTVTNFANKVKLVFKGVYEIFSTLKDGKGELSAELAKEIEAAGLMNLVTTISRIVYRIKNFFQGLAAGIKAGIQPALERLGDAFRLVVEAVRPLFGQLTDVAGGLALAAGQTGVEPWQAWGRAVGENVGDKLGKAVDIIGVAATAMGWLIEAVFTCNSYCSALGTALGDLLFDAVAFATGVKDSVVSFAGDIINAVTSAIEALFGFDMSEAGTSLINTFITGIKAGAESLVAAVSEVLSRVRAYLPFSDAQVGPLSNLTASGMAFISTFAAGIKAKAESLVATVSGILGQVRSLLPFSDAKEGPLSALTASGMAIPGTLAQGVTSGAGQLTSAAENILAGLNLASPYYEMPGAGYLNQSGTAFPQPSFSAQDDGQGQSPFRRWGEDQAGGRGTYNIHIGRIDLPNVKDADGFIAGLEAIIAERA